MSINGHDTVDDVRKELRLLLSRSEVTDILVVCGVDATYQEIRGAWWVFAQHLSKYGDRSKSAAILNTESTDENGGSQPARSHEDAQA